MEQVAPVQVALVQVALVQVALVQVARRRAAAEWVVPAARMRHPLRRERASERDFGATSL